MRLMPKGAAKSATAALRRRLSEMVPWTASWAVPMATEAAARPRETVRPAACHSRRSRSTRARYEP